VALFPVLLEVRSLKSNVNEDAEARVNLMAPDCNIRSSQARPSYITSSHGRDILSGPVHRKDHRDISLPNKDLLTRQSN